LWPPGIVPGGENRAVPLGSLTQYWGSGNLGSPSGTENPPGSLTVYGPSSFQWSKNTTKRDEFGYVH